MNLDELFLSVIGETLTLPTTLLILAVSLLLGLAISAVYIFTNKKKGYSQSFAVTLIMLPLIISIIIALVGDNVARAFSLAGAFTIVRFRSAPGSPKDITFVFFALAVGLACGMGYLAYAVLFTLVLCVITIILSLTKYAKPSSSRMTLRITIPESLNFSGLFDDILSKYTASWDVKKVKTVDYGSLFEISYNIRMKNDAEMKAFIDEIRTRNGNLNVALTLASSDEQTETF